MDSVDTKGITPRSAPWERRRGLFDDDVPPPTRVESPPAVPAVQAAAPTLPQRPGDLFAGPPPAAPTLPPRTGDAFAVAPPGAPPLPQRTGDPFGLPAGSDPSPRDLSSFGRHAPQPATPQTGPPPLAAPQPSVAPQPGALLPGGPPLTGLHEFQPSGLQTTMPATPQPAFQPEYQPAAPYKRSPRLLVTLNKSRLPGWNAECVARNFPTPAPIVRSGRMSRSERRKRSDRCWLGSEPESIRESSTVAQTTGMRRNRMTTTQSLSVEAQNFNWLLNSFVEKTAGVRQAISVSSDGLLMAISSTIDRATADRFAAIISGLTSLSDGAARTLDMGGLSQVVIEMRRGYLFVTQISGGSCLGVAADRDADIGLIGYEIALLVQRFGSSLTPAIIAELQANLLLA